ncbi:glycosyltransferase [Sphingomonas jatrophae]|uniref:Glycosyl transferase family 2 n=1 Tax=Sphingomonas jatrophae TaxID=1166337 RepID=A0A1I6MC20_9SPHN|nr:glycosyltransferase [Sphingomonas jatrophae]SFS13142.1 Glycosyl transferase family 2 [Sphingomonas jatrophae]
MRTAVLMTTLGEAGWDRSLPSLLAQTRPADRIIVVIDRASDGAEQAAMTAAWPGVTFLFNAANIGITASLNRALAAADGADICFRADDDDVSAPTRFERQIACFEATGADLVAAWATGTIETGATYAIRCPTEHDAIVAALAERNVLVHPTLAFRRASIVALGGYDETFRNAQDYALYLAAIRAGCRFAAAGEPLVTRHYHAGNISVKRRMNQLMYSCAARCVHVAASGDRRAFLRTLRHYAALAMTPMWARAARRRLFSLGGRGR